MRATTSSSADERSRPETSTHTMHVVVLYPERLNLYADRGNLLVLAQRCHRRQIAFSVTAIGVGEDVDIAACRPDLVYLGGGQDRDQRRCADDLQRHRERLATLAAAGTTVLGICGGYQLLGHEYVTPEGVITGLGLLDVTTVREEGPRLVGNAAVAVDGGSALAGFENHQGRSTLGPGSAPLGTVLAGHGNNGVDGTEGAVAGSVIGTYLHGPLLAKNVWFADRLIATAIGVPPTQLAPIVDRFAADVHRRALASAVSSS